MEEPDFPYPTQNGYRKVKLSIIFGIFFVAVVTGIMLLKQQPKKIEVQKVIAVEYKQLSNSPTAKPLKAKKDVTIKVLNGSGIFGQAGIVAKALENAGYSLDHIKSGNSETFNHSSTTITSRADFGEIVSNIKDVLKPLLPDITNGILNSNPNEDSGFDIVIVTGSP